jgi:hypothetical protein
MALFLQNERPETFVGTPYLKESMLKIFLREIHSGSYDHELNQQQKEAISEAIYADVEYQHLNLDNIFSTGNPYLVLYNKHPSLLKSPTQPAHPPARPKNAARAPQKCRRRGSNPRAHMRSGS